MKEESRIVTESPPHRTARGITTDGLDELDAARRTISRFEEEIDDRLCERGLPERSAFDVLLVLADLVSEPVV